MSSDSDSTDSDKGIRYKTQNTRIRDEPHREQVSSARSRHKSSSHKHRKKKHKKDRNSSSDEDEYHRSRRREKDHKKRHRDELRTREKCSDDEKSSYKTSNIAKVDSSKESNILSNTSKEVNTSFGPALPPHLQVKSDSKSVNNEENVTNSLINGPALPPHLINPTHTCSVETNSDKEMEEVFPSIIPPPTSEEQDGLKKDNITSIIGPALPAHLMQKLAESNANEEEPPSVIGPTVPSQLQSEIHMDEDEEIPTTSPEESNTEKILGPVLPPHLRQQLLEESSTQQADEEDDTYGPLPPGANFSKSHIELEERALQMRINQLDAPTDKEPTREEWMMELPPAAASFGLGPRTFRTKERPDLSDR